MDKHYIESLESELTQNAKLKNIENDVKIYRNTNLEELLLKTGYEDERIKTFVTDSEKYYNEHGELEVNEGMFDLYSTQIKNDVVSSVVTKGKEVIYLLGLPGSGKSSSLNLISKRYGGRSFYLIDADIFKEGKIKKDGVEIISPIANKDNNGIDIESIHEASSILAKFITELLSANDYNIALPKVGDNIDKLREIIVHLKQKGYKIYIHFLYTSVETALKRNVERFLKATNDKERRRLVPGKYIYEVGYKPLYNFMLLIKDDICDDYALWDAERCKIGQPVLLISK